MKKNPDYDEILANTQHWYFLGKRYMCQANVDFSSPRKRDIVEMT